MKYLVYITEKNYRCVEVEADDDDTLEDMLADEAGVLYLKGQESGMTEYEYDWSEGKE